MIYITLNAVQFISMAQIQHRYTLLKRGIKVYVDAGQPLSTVVWGTS